MEFLYFLRVVNVNTNYFQCFNLKDNMETPYCDLCLMFKTFCFKHIFVYTDMSLTKWTQNFYINSIFIYDRIYAFMTRSTSYMYLKAGPLRIR